MDLDLERQVLSAVIHGQGWKRVADRWRPNAFASDEHRALSQTILDVATAHDGMVTKTFVLGAVGATSRLRTLIDEIAPKRLAVGELREGLEHLLQLGSVRQMGDEMNRMLGEYYTGRSADWNAWMREAPRRLHRLAHQGRSKLIRVSDATVAAFDRATGAVERPQCIETGFPSLDELMGGGLWPTKQVLLSGSTKSGKTALIEQVVANTMVPTLVVSLELQEHEWADRGLSQASHVAYDRILRAKPSPEEQRKLIAAVQNAPPCAFVYDTRANAQAVLGYLTDARKLFGDIQHVVVDYLQLMPAPTGFERESREQQVSQNGIMLKRIGEEERVAMTVLVQVNNADNVRDASAVANHCDQWLHIKTGKREKDVWNKTISMRVARNVEMGTRVDMSYQGWCLRWSEVGNELRRHSEET